MSWRDSYRQGSWRGVPFRTAETTREGGRRGESFEFPQKDVPYREDLGRKGRTFTIDCWVAGDDVFEQCRSLIDACEAFGPGTLIHPFDGEMTVALITYSCDRSAVVGGIAEFSLEFEETSTQAASAISAPDSAAQARGAAELARAGAPGIFASGFSTAGLPGFIEDAGVRLVETAADLTRIASAPLGGVGSALLAFDAGLRLLPASARALVRQPLALARSVTGLFAALSALASEPRRRAASARTLIGYGDGFKPVTGTTPPRLAEARNQAAMIALVRVAASAELVSALADTRFTSYQEASAARDDAAARIDDVAIMAADAGDDANWRAAIALRTAMTADLTQRGATLARVYNFRPRVTEPALVISRRLTEATSSIEERAADIVARNRIAHPGFVPGGRDLSILQEARAA